MTKIALAEVRPRRRSPLENLRALEGVLDRVPAAEIAVFPELYLSGYMIGDAFHRLALSRAGKELKLLSEIAERKQKWVLVGAPMENHERKGEVINAAVLIGPKGDLHVTGKRYLPTFGPFEEGLQFSPGGDRSVAETPFGRIGVLICYEVFFPEITRALALSGADLFLVISASPVTSRSLFAKLLPARAIENATPLAYVNRVGVEDSIVFAGGSGFYDPRGEVLEPERLDLGEGQQVLTYDVPLEDYAKYRPSRPVLRDASVLS